VEMFRFSDNLQPVIIIRDRRMSQRPRGPAPVCLQKFRTPEGQCLSHLSMLSTIVNISCQ